MNPVKRSFLIPPTGESPERISRYSSAAPWAEEEVCFTISNYSYPTMHTHEYFEIFLVLSGSELHKISGTQYVMHRGDCCLIRPDDRHCLESLPPSEVHESFLSVNFMCQPVFFNRVVGVYDEELTSFIMRDSNPLAFSISAMMLAEIEKTCLYIQTPAGTPSKTNVLICKALVIELISECIQAHFIKAHNYFPDWLQDFILILQDPKSFSKKLDELVSGIPYSYSYIQKQFKQHLDTSIIGYINSVKMAYAKDLLLTTQMTVSDLAIHFGFDSVAHLNHLFKKSYGMSPTEFRKQNKI